MTRVCRRPGKALACVDFSAMQVMFPGRMPAVGLGRLCQLCGSRQRRALCTQIMSTLYPGQALCIQVNGAVTGKWNALQSSMTANRSHLIVRSPSWAASWRCRRAAILGSRGECPES